MRQASAAREPRAAIVDLVHQVEHLDRRLEGRRQADRRGIVYADVDAAELGYRLGDCALDLLRKADVALDRQRFAASAADLFSRGMNRSGQLGMRLGRLCRDRDARALARCTQRDGEPDAAAAAGDDRRFARNSRVFNHLETK